MPWPDCHQCLRRQLQQRSSRLVLRATLCQRLPPSSRKPWTRGARGAVQLQPGRRPEQRWSGNTLPARFLQHRLRDPSRRPHLCWRPGRAELLRLLRSRLRCAATGGGLALARLRTALAGATVELLGRRLASSERCPPDGRLRLAWQRAGMCSAALCVQHPFWTSILTRLPRHCDGSKLQRELRSWFRRAQCHLELRHRRSAERHIPDVLAAPCHPDIDDSEHSYCQQLHNFQLR